MRVDTKYTIVDQEIDDLYQEEKMKYSSLQEKYMKNFSYENCKDSMHVWLTYSSCVY